MPIDRNMMKFTNKLSVKVDNFIEVTSVEYSILRGAIWCL